MPRKQGFKPSRKPKSATGSGVIIPTFLALPNTAEQNNTPPETSSFTMSTVDPCIWLG